MYYMFAISSINNDTNRITIIEIIRAHSDCLLPMMLDKAEREKALRDECRSRIVNEANQ